MLLNSTRIIFFTNSLSIVSEEWMRREIKLLSKHIVAIVCFSSELKQFEGIPVYRLQADLLPVVRIKRHLGLKYEENVIASNSVKLNNVLKKTNANVLLIQYMTNAVYFESLLPKLKLHVLIQMHGYDVSWDMCEHNPPFNKVFTESYIDKVHKIAQYSTLLANSYNMLKDLSKTLNPLALHQYKFGVELQEIKKEKSLKKSLDILYVGRLIDLKGPDLLMEAFIEARKKGMMGTLTVIGSGPMQITCELLKLRSKFSNDIKIIGNIPYSKLEPFWEAADVIAAHHQKGSLTNQEESFGIVFLEAFSKSIPAMTTINGNYCEFIEHGKNAILTAQGDIQAQANALVKLSMDRELLKQLGQNAYNTVKDNYLPEHEYQNFISIIESL